MKEDYSKMIFHHYNKLRDSLRSGGDGKLIGVINQEELYNEIYKKYYRAILKKNAVKKDAHILEIGCNLGGVLRPLYRDGYKNCYGMDLSVKDIEIAQRRNPNIRFWVGDALQNSSYHREYDVIINKAVLEHIKKENVFQFIENMKEHLSENGILIIDVPNMDWIWGLHERYMDFTHEGGFTKESLEEVIGMFFDKYEFLYCDEISEKTIKNKIARETLWWLYSNATNVTSKEALFSRSIIVVAKNGKKKTPLH